MKGDQLRPHPHANQRSGHLQQDQAQVQEAMDEYLERL